jgi:hypothetical protein
MYRFEDMDDDDWSMNEDFLQTTGHKRFKVLQAEKKHNSHQE